MKKIILTLGCMLFTISASFAATQLKVVAVNDFNTANPSDHIGVRVMEEAELGQDKLDANSVLYCKILSVTEPKRGKRNATFYVTPVSFTDHNQTTKIEDEMYGKYSKFVLSKEELKKIPSFDNMKKAALSVGNHFVKGISVAYSFVEGVIKNEKDNRIKSGVVNAYEESPLSYISEGQEVDLKVGDDFYLVFKTKKDKENDEPNYSYTPVEENNKIEENE